VDFFLLKKKNLFFSIYLLSITKISDCQFLTGGNDIVADIFSSLFGFLSCTEKQYQPAPQASQAQGNECSGLMVVYFSYWHMLDFCASFSIHILLWNH